MLSLETYYKEIEEKPILSREEEELLYPILKTDADARKKLVEGNLKLALKYARAFKRKNPKYELNELIAEANLGLSVAIERFDPNKGFRFSTYAPWWINNRLTQFDLNNHSAVPSPKKIYYKYKKAQFFLNQDISDEELERQVGCSKAEIADISQYNSRKFISIDSTDDEQQSQPLQVDYSEDLDHEMMVQQLENIITETNILSEKERACVFALYGFKDISKQSQVELGKRLDEPVEEIRQIQRNAIKQLQDHLIGC